jgi:hypothetical protein
MAASVKNMAHIYKTTRSHIREESSTQLLRWLLIALFNLNDADSTFLRNVGELVPDYEAL